MLDLHYVAGLFDGEGWVRIERYQPKVRKTPRYVVIAGIAMTYKPVMEMIHQQFGGHLYGDDGFRRKYHKNRTIYRWAVSSQSATRFLTTIAPLLIVKREQADLSLELQAHIAEFKSKMVGSAVDTDFKNEIYAHRQRLADRVTALKKVNYDLPVEGDPMLLAS